MLRDLVHEIDYADCPLRPTDPARRASSTTRRPARHRRRAGRHAPVAHRSVRRDAHGSTTSRGRPRAASSSAPPTASSNGTSCRGRVRHTRHPTARRRSRSSRHDLDRDIVMGTQARAALDLRPRPDRRARRPRRACDASDGIAAVRSATRPATRRREIVAVDRRPTRGDAVTGSEAPRVLAVIPARGGSKGLPGKNTRRLFGLPLIVHSIRAAELTPQITRCVVSTDSEQIAAVARELRRRGALPPTGRARRRRRADGPRRAPRPRVVRAATRACRYDAVLLLDPTSPRRGCPSSSPMPPAGSSPPRPRRGRQRVGADVQPGVGRRAPRRVARRRPAPLLRLRRPGVTRRQDAERFLRINGNFYLWRSDFVRRLESSWFDEGTHAGAEIPESQAFSIDDEYEFRLIEALIVAGIIRLPWIEGMTHGRAASPPRQPLGTHSAPDLGGRTAVVTGGAGPARVGARRRRLPMPAPGSSSSTSTQACVRRDRGLAPRRAATSPWPPTSLSHKDSRASSTTIQEIGCLRRPRQQRRLHRHVRGAGVCRPVRRADRRGLRDGPRPQPHGALLPDPPARPPAARRRARQRHQRLEHLRTRRPELGHSTRARAWATRRRTPPAKAVSPS